MGGTCDFLDEAKQMTISVTAGNRACCYRGGFGTLTSQKNPNVRLPSAGETFLRIAAESCTKQSSSRFLDSARETDHDFEVALSLDT